MVTLNPAAGEEQRMKEDKTTTQIVEALLEVAPEIEPASLDPEVSFRDQFEIDSVDFMGFVMALEKRLGIKVPEVDYPKLSSLNGCLAYLAGRGKG